MDFEYFRICGTCFKLYETGRSDDQAQRCGCDSRKEKTWPGRDFNERACLCACCGTEVLESGSRYSPYFCRECQLLAMGVSLWERRLVIPIGRHTMMHTWVPNTRMPSLGAHGGDARGLAETVHGALTAISTSSEQLSKWSAMAVSQHLKRLGLPGDTPLSQYLTANATDEQRPTRWALFGAMCEFISHNRP